MKVKSEKEVAQSCPTLRDPMDCSPPGSSVHGILQARVLEWGAIVLSVRRDYLGFYIIAFFFSEALEEISVLLMLFELYMYILFYGDRSQKIKEEKSTCKLPL